MLSKRKKKAILLAVIAACAADDDDRSKRECWMKPWLAKRNSSSSSSNVTIHRELRSEDQVSLRNYVHFSPDVFSHLLRLVTPHIERQDTTIRECISPGARLEATLLFLSAGCTYRDLQYSTRISQPSLSLIIPETCDAIYKVLKPDYVKTPTNPSEWKTVADGFYTKWNFPNCLGAVGGKHILIRPSSQRGSFYYNYKGSHSIILMAAVDAGYSFLFVDVGTNGRVSDAAVWDTCTLKDRLERNDLGIPQDCKLPQSEAVLPHVFIGDDAFPLKRNFLKPYPFRQQSEEQRIFSYRLSRARRTVENAFGILGNRFRVLLAPIKLSPAKVEKIILACVAMHNFLIKENNSDYAPSSDVDQEDIEAGLVQPASWRRDGDNLLRLQTHNRRPTGDALVVRDSFCAYFNNEGSVHWQRRMAGLK